MRQQSNFPHFQSGHLRTHTRMPLAEIYIGYMANQLKVDIGDHFHSAVSINDLTDTG